MAEDETPVPDTKGRFTPSLKLKCLLVFVSIYTALSVVGDHLIVDGSTSGPIWPAAGVGLIAVAFCGRIALIAIFIGSLVSINYGGIDWKASSKPVSHSRARSLTQRPPPLASFLGLPPVFRSR